MASPHRVPRHHRTACLSVDGRRRCRRVQQSSVWTRLTNGNPHRPRPDLPFDNAILHNARAGNCHARCRRKHSLRLGLSLSGSAQFDVQLATMPMVDYMNSHLNPRTSKIYDMASLYSIYEYLRPEMFDGTTYGSPTTMRQWTLMTPRFRGLACEPRDGHRDARLSGGYLVAYRPVAPPQADPPLTGRSRALLRPRVNPALHF